MRPRRAIRPPAHLRSRRDPSAEAGPEFSLRRLWLRFQQQEDKLATALVTGMLVEPCEERSLPALRRWGRALIRLVGFRPAPPAKARPLRPDERSAAEQQLARAQGALGQLRGLMERLARLPEAADPLALAAGADGYPEDWDATSLSYRQRVGFICEVCGAHAPDGHVHHLHPVSRGGGSEEDNLIFLCRACHAAEHPHMRED